MYNQNLDVFINKLLRIPYRHQGRDYDGADCGGGIIIFYRDFLGIELPDFNLDYDQNWCLKSNKSIFLENYYTFFYKVYKPNKFDIILFQTKNGIANHGGVVISRGRFFHISKTGASINSYNDENFRRRFNGFYRYKNI